MNKEQSEEDDAVDTLKSQFFYVKGKLKNVFDTYNEEAHGCLLESFSLDKISFPDAWASLSFCYAKQRKLDMAISVLQEGLDVVGSHKVLFMGLSDFQCKKALNSFKENGTFVMEDATNMITNAKEAQKAEFGQDDGMGKLLRERNAESQKILVVLGNAYLANWVLHGCKERSTLVSALESYLKTTPEGMGRNPFLLFSRAIAHKFLGNYNEALVDFEKATQRKPNLGADEEMEKILRLLKKIPGSIKVLLNRKKKMKRGGKKTPRSEVDSVGVSLDQLQEGYNNGLIVSALVESHIMTENDSLIYYLLSDAKENYFLFSADGLSQIEEGSSIRIWSPVFHNINFYWETVLYSFKSVQLRCIEDLDLIDSMVPPQRLNSSFVASGLGLDETTM